jgi:hypothetical protein
MSWAAKKEVLLGLCLMIILKMSQCLSKKSLAVISSESSFLIKE